MKWLEAERDLLPLEWDYDAVLDAWRVFVPDWPNPEKDMHRWVESRTFALLLAQKRAAAYQQDIYVFEWLRSRAVKRAGYERSRHGMALDQELAKAIIRENNKLVIHLVVHPDGSYAHAADPRTKLGRLRAFCGVE